MRILIVDDEKDHLDTLRRMLRSRGYKIVEAQNTETALNILDDEAGNIDMVITDYVMQGDDGISLLKEIRNYNRKMPIIMMTAHVSKALLIDAIHHQCTGFIEKPFTLEALLQEIEKAKDSARQDKSTEDIKFMLPTIMHQINNPLQTIMASARMALVKAGDEKSVAGHIEKIMDAVKQIEIINKSVYQLYTNKGIPLFEGRSKPIELLAILKNTVGMFLDLMEIKSVACIFDSGPEDELWAVGNTYALRQVFYNLVSNAIDAMENSKEKVLQITAGHSDESRNVRVCIRDTGCGLKGVDHARLFDPYYTNKKNGNGLGLYIVKKVLNRLGGDIGLSDGPEDGAMAVVQLCAAERPAARGKAVAATTNKNFGR